MPKGNWPDIVSEAEAPSLVEQIRRVRFRTLVRFGPQDLIAAPEWHLNLHLFSSPPILVYKGAPKHLFMDGATTSIEI